MKIILFSDIHANLPALGAFFEDIKDQDYDSIYCLGDLVSYNVWPNEVIEKIRARKIPTIAGNHDYKISRLSLGLTTLDGKTPSNGAISAHLTNELIKDVNRAYLRELPAHIQIEYQLNQDSLKVLLVHGSPRKNNEYLHHEMPEESMAQTMTEADADILCFGHTHIPYHRVINTGNESKPYFRHAINTGSIGKPKDHDPRGSYVIINIDKHATVKDSSSISVEIVRFKYDIEKAAKAVEDSLMPNAFAAILRQGY